MCPDIGSTCAHVITRPKDRAYTVILESRSENVGSAVTQRVSDEDHRPKVLLADRIARLLQGDGKTTRVSGTGLYRLLDGINPQAEVKIGRQW